MMKGQKGITLVALVITIIVMLILVGVTISVAMNGGLFTKADDAAENTRKAQISEAFALAKAELLANFYSATTTAARAVPEIADVEDLINSYLEENLAVTLDTETEDGVYTLKSAPNVEYAEGTEPSIDISDLAFAEEPADPNGNGDA